MPLEQWELWQQPNYFFTNPSGYTTPSHATFGTKSGTIEAPSLELVNAPNGTTNNIVATQTNASSKQGPPPQGEVGTGRGIYISYIYGPLIPSLYVWRVATTSICTQVFVCVV